MYLCVFVFNVPYRYFFIPSFICYFFIDLGFARPVFLSFIIKCILDFLI